MLSSRRRIVIVPVSALVLASAALTACTARGESGQAGSGAPSTSVTASAPVSARASASTPPGTTASGAAPGGGTGRGQASAPADTSAPTGATTPAGAARWAGTKQFVQISKAWISGGRTYLSVRTAQKVAVTGPYEAWHIMPGQGPYATVSMAADGRVLLSAPLGDDSQPVSYSQAEFVRRLTAESSLIRPALGYDLSFDGTGRVSRVQSLYTP
ncbi:hypothetical protein LK07_16180 [Streptomyces pluripotens]|uniref:Lipoprotein n=1 Tax=Streptomyces pluripotens TaxID=1355015 RepID=A0A221NZ93_9ACTN|nr:MULTISPECIES: hypothetical protein [Streptomyces]ARP71058.1 hypothetical protein LK06_015045 [Streptomyces pluripotens]ASN25307.1 hypothetical protein LK07_16180 [Streptomyces pluripotens]KIE25944.1 hypothetical protein LK08_16075 [Streptomyces sp. MUSC 125]MCH0557172.1 hypothetical protein [Streptomyces sp. MUM 16J]